MAFLGIIEARRVVIPRHMVALSRKVIDRPQRHHIAGTDERVKIPAGNERAFLEQLGGGGVPRSPVKGICDQRIGRGFSTTRPAAKKQPRFFQRVKVSFKPRLRRLVKIRPPQKRDFLRPVNVDTVPDQRLHAVVGVEFHAGMPRRFKGQRNIGQGIEIGMKPLKLFLGLGIAYRGTPTDTAVKIFLVYQIVHRVAQIFKIGAGVEPAAGKNKQTDILGSRRVNKTRPYVEGNPRMN